MNGPSYQPTESGGVTVEVLAYAFRDDQGRVAPWPSDTDEWTRVTNEPHTPDPG